MDQARLICAVLAWLGYGSRLSNSISNKSCSSDVAFLYGTVSHSSAASLQIYTGITRSFRRVHLTCLDFNKGRRDCPRVAAANRAVGGRSRAGATERCGAEEIGAEAKGARILICFSAVLPV